MPLPLLTFTLNGWKGLNTLPNLVDKDPHYLEDCQNVDVDDDGVIAKRRGMERLTGITFGGPIHMIADFQNQAGFGSTATDRQRVIIVAGTTLCVIQSFHTAGYSINKTFSVSNALHYHAISNNGACYISNENGGAAPKVLCYAAGDWQYTSAELLSPTAASTISAGTTGSLTGTFYHRYTYVDIFGNESNPSIAQTTGVYCTTQTLECWVAPSSDPTVIEIDHYVLTPSGSQYRFVGTSSNTSSTYSVSVSEIVINSGVDLEFDHFECPKGKYVVIYNDMLIVAGDTSIPDIVYQSNWRYHRQFSTGTDFVRVVSGDGQAVKGFGHVFQDLVIAKADSLYLGQGTDNLNFNAIPHNQEYGILGQPSMTYFWQRLAFFSDDGIYVDNNVVPTEISRLIRTTLRKLNPANLTCIPPKQYCANYKYYKKIMWSVREATGAGENDTILVYNYELDTWVRYKGIEAICMGVVQKSDNYEFLYGGDSNGNLYWFTPPNGNSPNSDNHTGTKTAISAYAETPWIHLPRAVGVETWEQSRTEAVWVKIYAGGEPASGNSTISIVTNFYTDFSSTIRGTFTTTHNATAWPETSIDPKKFIFGGTLGTFNWIKFKFSNAVMDEHFKLHKIVVGFRARPQIEN